MRLGEFEREDYPHSAINTSVINSKAHQDLVRQVAGASVIMAVNRNKTLPILSPLPTRNIALGLCAILIFPTDHMCICAYMHLIRLPAPVCRVCLHISVGPFADCGQCYLHSYNGQPNHIAGYIEGVQSMCVVTPAPTIVLCYRFLKGSLPWQRVERDNCRGGLRGQGESDRCCAEDVEQELLI